MNGHDFKKYFGQNFFLDEYWPQKLAEAADINETDIVIEIGPGDGKVTEILLKKAKQVIAVEIDETLIPVLKNKFADQQNFKLLFTDILQLNINELGLSQYKVVGSLPYNISKKIISIFLQAQVKPSKMALVIQKEVADDYVATPPDASFLGNSAQIYSDIKLLEVIPKEDFYPTPKVAGGLLVFDNIKTKFENPESLIKFIKTGYASPRKKLSSNLATAGHSKQRIQTWLTDNQLSDSARASELNLSQWHNLFQHIKAN